MLLIWKFINDIYLNLFKMANEDSNSLLKSNGNSELLSTPITAPIRIRSGFRVKRKL